MPDGRLHSGAMREVATEEAEPAKDAESSRRARLGWPLAVLAAVVLANVLPLLGIVNVDPLVPVGRTGLVGKGGFLPGQPFTDNYAGWTSQALGHLAAVDWLHACSVSSASPPLRPAVGASSLPSTAPSAGSRAARRTPWRSCRS
jgi:hypothetical protein